MCASDVLIGVIARTTYVYTPQTNYAHLRIHRVYDLVETKEMPVP
jgi:hypothetical protein